ncbi:MAG: hypothetical protein ACI8W3_001130 [Myxococcota bacterium]|jgi:hypothetical protein
MVFGLETLSRETLKPDKNPDVGDETGQPLKSFTPSGESLDAGLRLRDTYRSSEAI